MSLIGPRPERPEIEEELEAQAQEENIEIIESEEGLTIRIKDNAIFDSGEALIKPEIMPIPPNAFCLSISAIVIFNICNFS